MKYAALDLVLLIAFAILARVAHDMGLSIGGIAATIWPFLVGALVGWLMPWMRRRPAAVGSGFALMTITVVVGHVLKSIEESRVSHWSFVLVTLVVLTAFFVGWRLLHALVTRRRTARVA